jgi:hypothetical protein
MTNPYSTQKNVTTSGTPVQLPSQTIELDQSVAIKAKAANTGTICVGYSSADALNSGTTHFKLTANEALDEVKVVNLNQIWIDSTVNGEGVEIFVG